MSGLKWEVDGVDYTAIGGVTDLSHVIIEEDPSALRRMLCTASQSGRSHLLEERNAHGRTPVQLAIRFKSLPCLEELLRAGARFSEVECRRPRLRGDGMPIEVQGQYPPGPEDEEWREAEERRQEHVRALLEVLPKLLRNLSHDACAALLTDGEERDGLRLQVNGEAAWALLAERYGGTAARRGLPSPPLPTNDASAAAGLSTHPFPLHVAVRARREGLLGLLLTTGAYDDLNAEDEGGETAFSLAAHSWAPQAARRLQEEGAAFPPLYSCPPDLIRRLLFVSGAESFTASEVLTSPLLTWE
jgi:hypothetical protein